MNARRRPDETGAAQESAGWLTTPKDTSNATNSHADLDAAEHFRNCFAVLVRGKTVRRHLYFNLPAAERAVKRALLRGDRADLVLVQLVPVDSRKQDRAIRRPAEVDESLRRLDDGGMLDVAEAGDDL